MRLLPWPCRSCDLIAVAARDILRGSSQAQLLMVGPIGDEYGAAAKAMLGKGEGCLGQGSELGQALARICAGGSRMDEAVTETTSVLVCCSVCRLSGPGVQPGW